MPEPSEHWVTVLQVVGTGAAIALTAFWQSYKTERNRAQVETERAPEIVGNAVGAAFVDRSAAQALAGLGRDVSDILDIMREYAEHDAEDRIEKRVMDKIAAAKNKLGS